MHKTQFSIRGIYRDVLVNSENEVIHDSQWTSNTIVTRCRVLLAGFMRNDPSSGIQFLFVGQGDANWDTNGAPSSPDSTTDLVAPFNPGIPAGDLQLEYLDTADTVQFAPSPRLQITATLLPGYPTPLGGLSTYPLREFGLFGVLDGNSYMINSIRHPVIQKDANSTLIRVVRLYF